MRPIKALELLPDAIPAMLDITGVTELEVTAAKVYQGGSIVHTPQQQFEARLFTLIKILEKGVVRTKPGARDIGFAVIGTVRKSVEVALIDDESYPLSTEEAKEQVRTHEASYRQLLPFMTRQQRRQIGALTTEGVIEDYTIHPIHYGRVG